MAQEKTALDIINTGNLSEKNPSVSGILAGISKGLVWYNKEENPTLAVTYSYCVGGCGIVGNIGDKKEAKLFFERVFNSLKDNGIYEFEFSAEDENIYTDMRELFPEKSFSSEMEFSFRKEEKIDPSRIVAGNNIFQEEIDPKTNTFSHQTNQKMYEIKVVDEQLLSDIHNGTVIDNGLVGERLENSWDSIDQFIKYSKSIVAMIGNEIVGIIFGSSRYKEVIDVDIEVLENYRKQGIASQLTAAFVNECIEQGMIVQWDCTESNEESRSLALRCGFQPYKQRPYYWFEF